MYIIFTEFLYNFFELFVVFLIARFPMETEIKFKPGTSEYADCITTYLKTLKALELSGSVNIFGFLIGTMCREDNHIASNLVANSLTKVCMNYIFTKFLFNHSTVGQKIFFRSNIS